MRITSVTYPLVLKPLMWFPALQSI